MNIFNKTIEQKEYERLQNFEKRVLELFKSPFSLKEVSTFRNELLRSS